MFGVSYSSGAQLTVSGVEARGEQKHVSRRLRGGTGWIRITRSSAVPLRLLTEKPGGRKSVTSNTDVWELSASIQQGAVSLPS